MKKHYIILISSFIFLLIIFSGCSKLTNQVEPVLQNTNNADNVKSFYFEENGKIYKMNGIKDKFAFFDIPIEVGEYTEVSWYFWGDTSKLLNKHMKIIGINTNSNKSVELVSINKIENKNYFNTIPIKFPNNEQTKPIAPIYLRANYLLPEAGIWKLEIYVDNELLGFTYVDVKNDSQKNSKYKIENLN